PISSSPASSSLLPYTTLFRSRLVEARHGDGTRERYRWDPASNLLEQPGLRGVEVGPGNRLRTANGERLAHDQRLRLCRREAPARDRKSTRLNSSHVKISYAVF